MLSYPSCYNLHMSKTVTTVDHSSVALAPEALDALGVQDGAQLEVEIVGRALVVRSVEDARRSRDSIMPSNQSSLSATPRIKNWRRVANAKHPV